MPRTRKRAAAFDDAEDLAAEPVGELDFDAGLPDHSSRPGRSRMRKRDARGARTYDPDAEIGEGHALGEAGGRYRDVFNFDDGFRHPREIVVKDAEGAKDAPERVKVDKSPPEKKTAVKAEEKPVAKPAPTPEPEPENSEPDAGPSLEDVIELVKQDKSEIQTLIFDKKAFESSADAKRWAKDHGFKSTKVDETGSSFRLRQKEPGAFEDGSFRTITLTDGIKAVIGKPKKAAAKKAEDLEFPDVLTWQAVRDGRMPEKGSGLPDSLEGDVPPEYRFWKCEDPEDARRVRDALVESRLFTPATIRKVDGQPRRAVIETVQKLFLPPAYDEDLEPTIPEARSSIDKVADMLEGEGDRTLLGDQITAALGIETILAKADQIDGRWVVASKDTPEIRKAISGPCFKLWTDPDLIFLTNAKLKDPDSVEWVQHSRAEELVKFAFGSKNTIRIIKAARKEEERIVFGVVLEPDGVDAQDDTVSKEEIREAAHKFMEDFGNLGLQHQEIANGRLVLLETFIAPQDLTINSETVKEGAWLLKERVVDDELWAAVQAGEFTGFSIGGSAVRKPV